MVKHYGRYIVEWNGGYAYFDDKDEAIDYAEYQQFFLHDQVECYDLEADKYIF